MLRRSGRVFAGRGITLKAVAITLATIAVAFALGLGAGWGTGFLADRLNAQPEPSPSPSLVETSTPEASVSVPPMTPITRALDAEDQVAGLTALDFPVRGDGTFTTARPLDGATMPAGLTRLVKIDVEAGLPIDPALLSTFVMATLNDSRGWAAEDGVTFVQTEGAPDIRVVLASPYTAAALCPTPHEPASLTPESPSASPSASPSPSVTPEPEPSGTLVTQCADTGGVVLSIYDWAAGVPAFAEDRTASREYSLNHGVGHVLGNADVTCTTGRADVMVDHMLLDDACTPNAWPVPDAE